VTGDYTHAGDYVLTGNLTVNGNITINDGDMNTDGISLKDHVHSGVDRGGSDTDPPVGGA
jgi:phage baseplate assembly protein gpV